MGKKIEWYAWILWILGIIVSIAIGGFFISGGFTGVFLLKYLPLLVHQIVGYSVIVTTIIGFVVKIVKAL